jgi:hypothetical protein
LNVGQHIVVDPISRIEGHLRIEAVLDNNNVITDAYSAGTMFRGIEIILKGRDPRDAGLLAQRICGVCTGVHYWTSVRRENAFSVTAPERQAGPRPHRQLRFIATTVHFTTCTPWTGRYRVRLGCRSRRQWTWLTGYRRRGTPARPLRAVQQKLKTFAQQSRWHLQRVLEASYR